MSAIRIDIVEKRFPAREGATARGIFRDFHLEVAAREFLVLLGASGLGKTTLLNIVAGLDRDYRGTVDFGSRTPRIAYAFQSPRLLPWRTVLENIALALPPGAAAAPAARAMLDDAGLADLAGAYPERLSLGQQRRVALARAFVTRPDILLMDEPFVSLDEASAGRLRDLLRRLINAHPATVLFVTHDSQEAASLGSRIVVLEGAPVHLARDIPVNLSADDRASPARLREFLATAGLAPAERPRDGH